MSLSGDALQCYCRTGDMDSLECSLQCRTCKKLFHLECLVNGKPSPLEGDSLFEFTCCFCSEIGIEQTSRIKVQWVEAIILALYNLQLKSGGKRGYFRWREHICNFIDKNWTTLFGFSKKKTSGFHGTVAGCLSAGSAKYFLSGSSIMKESGWWSLVTNKPPIRKDPDAINIGNRVRAPKAVPKPDPCFDHGSGPSFTIIKNSETRTADSTPSTSSAGSSVWNSRVHLSTSAATVPFSGEDDVTTAFLQDDMDLSDLDTEDLEINPGSVSPVSVSSPIPDNLMSDIYDMERSLKKENFSSSSSNSEDDDDEQDAMETLASFDEEQSNSAKRPVEDTEERPPSSSEEPTDEVSSSRGSDETSPASEYCIVPLGIYEEKLLVNRLKQLNDAVQKNETAKRLQRKLLLRQWKRDRGLPIFDLDDYIGDSKKTCTRNSNSVNNFVAREPVERILDRYRVGTVKNLEPRFQHNSFVTRLVGAGENLSPIVSPYTARVLKPYIWQDFESKPLKLRLLGDIVGFSRKKQGVDWTAPPSAPIDYCYVQPQHIPSINALCKQFFWDGIDMSESLQYPDFSCVALYRKVVIGFAFMVPDVKYNEAYISFIFTHPEWRNAGIASFMLYHLIQTCMGKDVTLHVSATSSAVLLYQKFGFKVEEFIVDFYDKYFSEENKECRHAMFLRLSR